ncbi:hypothetical protein BDB01DRAFT_249429 [Pilobolus umbonatus]|nr:hypothetical protein BDB01DRAFT_249429 [Pilobolus umbonatus]
MSKEGVEIECQTIKDCDGSEYCVNKKCVSTLTTYHEAYGTGLQYDEAMGRVFVVDSTKPTWTESTWDNPSVRIYSTTSNSHKTVELIVGILWMVTSMVTIIYIRKYLRKILKIE